MRIPPTLVFAATLSACASGAVPPPSPNHPASASAPEGTAYVPQPPASADAPAPPSSSGQDHHHDHRQQPAHGAHDHGAPEEGAPAEQGTYVCPMHPDVTSDAPGTCPKCGMKLVPKK